MTTTDNTAATLTARRRRIARVGRLLRATTWQRQTIELAVAPKWLNATEPARQTVEADVSGGLAVHRDSRYDAGTGAYDTWTVTHVQSGYGVMRCIPKERHARVVAVRLLALGEWTGDQASVRPIYEPHREAIRGWYTDAYAGPDEEEQTP